MQNAWHIVTWVWAAALLTFLVVQGVAAWRLDSGGKKRARTIMSVVLGLVLVQNLVRDVFENREASRFVGLIVVLAVLIATVILLRMLRAETLRGNKGIESGAEDEVQTLKLN